MGERRQNLIVGLFAVFGLVALCTMVVFFGGGPPGSPLQPLDPGR